MAQKNQKETEPAQLPAEFRQVRDAFKSVEIQASARALAAGAIARDILLDNLYEMESVGRSLVGQGALAAEDHAHEMEAAISETLTLDDNGRIKPPLADDEIDHLLGTRIIYQLAIANS